MLFPFRLNYFLPLVCLSVISHLDFAIPFLSFKHVDVFFGGQGVCTHIHPTKFPSSYVHFLSLQRINDFILFWASLRLQFLGIDWLLCYFRCFYLVSIYQTAMLANLVAKSIDNSVPVYISPPHTDTCQYKTVYLRL